MRSLPLLLPLLGLLLMSTATSGLAEERLVSPEAQLASLGWLAGHWRDATFETIYSSPEGGLMLSISKQYDHDGLAVFGEFEMFHIEDGVLQLVPFPGGIRSEHSFPLVECDPARHRVVFKNPEHDWPTTFIYECPTPDTLHITVSGPGPNETTSAIEFRLSRVLEPVLLERTP